MYIEWTYEFSSLYPGFPGLFVVQIAGVPWGGCPW